jgi:CRISPR-associated endonuclease/helicase Cas3
MLVCPWLPYYALCEVQELMKNPAETKSERLGEIEHLLLAHPEGLTQAEIARRLGVHRSTINRYVPNLPGSVYIDDLDGNKWKVDRQAYLVNVRFTLDEAMAIHLATRLLATRMERQNPHAAAALRKLGGALERLAPRISRHLLQSADMMDDPTQRQDPNFLRTLEIITLAWAQLHKVRLWHRKENGQVSEFVFAPYFIEPYAVGQAVHVIGWREPPDALRTLKLERIERVELLHETYSIPEDFDPAELLKDAWGIWYTEDEPVEVVLKFGPRVAHRVGETRWHRSEQVAVLEGGYLLWRARIAEPLEMLPWIRGWGSDVEVIAPEELREKIGQEAQMTAALYEDNICQ